MSQVRGASSLAFERLLLPSFLAVEAERLSNERFRLQRVAKLNYVDGSAKSASAASVKPFHAPPSARLSLGKTRNAFASTLKR
jgi:hypothetical protein